MWELPRPQNAGFNVNPVATFLAIEAKAVSFEDTDQDLVRGKSPTSFRLSARALRLIGELSAHTGIGRAACVEMAIREMARKKGSASMAVS